jgi:hypothetical protein
MTTYFIQVTVMVVGTADGPFNLLLNSLAMFFILECDDVIDFDLPNGGYFGALRLDAWQAHITWKASLQGVLESLADAVVKTARTSRAAERLYTAFERLSNPLISAARVRPRRPRNAAGAPTPPPPPRAGCSSSRGTCRSTRRTATSRRPTTTGSRTRPRSRATSTA